MNYFLLAGLGRAVLVSLFGVSLIACGAPAAPAPSTTPPAGVETPKASVPVTPIPKIEKVAVAVPVTGFNYLPLFVAKSKGFFDEGGLSVERLVLLSGDISVSALSSGEVDFNGSMASSMRAAVGGLPSKTVIFSFDRTMFNLVSRPEVRSVEELKGKVVGVGRIGTSAHTAAKVALRKYGLDPEKDVTIRGVGFAPAYLVALRAGSVDAAILEPDNAAIARTEGFRDLLFLGEIAPAPFSGFAVMDHKLKQTPNLVKKFIKGMVRATIYILDRPEEISQMAVKEFSMEQGLASEAMKIYLKGLSRADPGGATDEGIKLLIDMEIREPLGLKGDVPVNKIIDFTLLREVQKELKLR